MPRPPETVHALLSQDRDYLRWDAHVEYIVSYWFTEGRVQIDYNPLPHYNGAERGCRITNPHRPTTHHCRL
jgi:hypothetical protein